MNQNVHRPLIYLDKEKRKENPGGRFSVMTLGCRVNQVESDRLRREGAVLGWSPGKEGEPLDLVIVNTCSVTGESDRQARQLIRRIGRRHPQARIVVTGCYAQRDPAALSQMPRVDLVLGNQEKARLWEHLPDNKPAPAIAAGEERLSLGTWESSPGLQDRSRAYLQVQDGCSEKCTFCLIPNMRGKSRSWPPAVVVAEAEQQLAQGYGELVLTGINLGAYGRDLPHRHSLGGLIALLLKIPGLDRLRLSSLDPGDLDAAILAQFAASPKLCSHLHLSLQSGDDLTLKRMGRGYDRKGVLERVAALRSLRPDLVLGGDLIVGFPTETETAFQNTLALMEQIELALPHVFRYSDRPGTPAAAIGQRFRIPPQIMRQRSESLRLCGAAILARSAKKWLGRQVTVLLEKVDGEWAHGKSESFLPVRFPTRSPLPRGGLVTVDIVGFDDETGTLIGCY